MLGKSSRAHIVSARCAVPHRAFRGLRADLDCHPHSQVRQCVGVFGYSRAPRPKRFRTGRPMCGSPISRGCRVCRTLRVYFWRLSCVFLMSFGCVRGASSGESPWRVSTEKLVGFGLTEVGFGLSDAAERDLVIPGGSSTLRGRLRAEFRATILSVCGLIRPHLVDIIWIPARTNSLAHEMHAPMVVRP